MRLWTIQDMPFWNALQTQGQITTDPTKIRPSWFDGEVEVAYRWMSYQMVQRSIGTRPQGAELPIWAWRCWQGPNRPMPDLRYSGHLRAGERGVRIEIEVPFQHVLLSDFDLWHAPLNRGYLGRTDEESEAFYSDPIVEKMTHDELHADPVWRKKIMDSWENIFELDWNKKDIQVQATFWQLRMEMVKSVHMFTAKRTPKQ